VSLPDKDAVQTLDYAWRGLPHGKVEAKSLNTGSLDFAWKAYPFVAAFGGGAVATTIYWRMFHSH
jgi:hypothetical protein